MVYESVRSKRHVCVWVLFLTMLLSMLGISSNAMPVSAETTIETETQILGLDDNASYSFENVLVVARKYLSRVYGDKVNGQAQVGKLCGGLNGGTAGAFLSYYDDSDDKKTLAEDVAAHFSAVWSTGNATTYSLDSIRSLVGGGGVQYYAYGVLLKNTGLDQMAGTATNMVRTFAGFFVYVAFCATMFASFAFDLAFSLLDAINPFRFLSESEHAHGMTLTPNDSNPITSALDKANVIGWFSGLFDSFGDFALGVMIPLSVVFLAAGFFLFKSYRADAGQHIKKIVVRILFFVIGIPLLGTTYTKTLDSLKATVQEDNNYMSDAICSTFFDFQSFVERGMPVADVGFLGGATVKVNQYTIDCAYNTYRNDIASCNHEDYDAFSANTTGAFAFTDNFETHDLQMGSAVSNLAGKWQSSKSTAASKMILAYMANSTYDSAAYAEYVYANIGNKDTLNGMLIVLSNEYAYDDANTDPSAGKTMQKASKEIVHEQIPDALTDYVSGLGLAEKTDANNRTYYEYFGGASVLSGISNNPFSNAVNKSSSSFLNVPITVDKTTPAGGGSSTSNTQSVSGLQLSSMSIINYLNTNFMDGQLVVYSNDKSPSKGTSTAHYAIVLAGPNAMAKVASLFNIIALGLGYFILISEYIIKGVGFDAVMRTFDVLSEAMFAALGIYKAMARCITATFCMLCSLFVSIAFFTVVTDLMFVMSGAIQTFMDDISANSILEGSSLNLIFAPIASGVMILFFVRTACRWRKDIVKTFNDMIEEIVDTLLGVRSGGAGNGIGDAMRGGASDVMQKDLPGMAMAAGLGAKAAVGTAATAAKVGAGAVKLGAGAAAGIAAAVDTIGDEYAKGVTGEDNAELAREKLAAQRKEAFDKSIPGKMANGIGNKAGEVADKISNSKAGQAAKNTAAAKNPAYAAGEIAKEIGDKKKGSLSEEDGTLQSTMNVENERKDMGEAVMKNGLGGDTADKAAETESAASETESAASETESTESRESASAGESNKTSDKSASAASGSASESTTTEESEETSETKSGEDAAKTAAAAAVGATAGTAAAKAAEGTETEASGKTEDTEQTGKTASAAADSKKTGTAAEGTETETGEATEQTGKTASAAADSKTKHGDVSGSETVDEAADEAANPNVAATTAAMAAGMAAGAAAEKAAAEQEEKADSVQDVKTAESTKKDKNGNDVQVSSSSNGTRVETTTDKDTGEKTEVETTKDGVKTTTKTDADGNVMSKVTENPKTGTTETETATADGSKSVVTDKNGNVLQETNKDKNGNLISSVEYGKDGSVATKVSDGNGGEISTYKNAETGIESKTEPVYERDAEGNLVKDKDGNAVQIGSVTHTTGPDGYEKTETKDKDGNVTSMTESKADGSSIEMKKNEQTGAVTTKETAANGATTTTTTSADGKHTETKDVSANGQVTTETTTDITIDKDGKEHVNVHTVEKNAETGYSKDETTSDGKVVSSHEEAPMRDSKGNIMKDADGNTMMTTTDVSHGTDEHGNGFTQTTVKSGNGAVSVTTAMDDGSNTTTMMQGADGNLHTMSTSYDKNGNAIKTVENTMAKDGSIASSVTTETKRDASGNAVETTVTEEKDGNRHSVTTARTFDANGNETSSRVANTTDYNAKTGASVVTTTNADGSSKTVSDVGDVHTEVSKDANGNRTHTVETNKKTGESSDITFNADGSVDGVYQSANGNVSTVHTNADGSSQGTLTDKNGNVLATGTGSVDANGNRTLDVAYTNGAASHIVYNKDGSGEETVTSADGKTSTTKIDTNGNVSTTGDASVSETKTENADGTTTVKKTVRNALGEETTVETVSDSKGNVQSVTTTNSGTSSDVLGQEHRSVTVDKQSGIVTSVIAGAAGGTIATAVNSKTGETTVTTTGADGSVTTVSSAEGGTRTVSTSGSVTTETVTDSKGNVVSTTSSNAVTGASVTTDKQSNGDTVMTTEENGNKTELVRHKNGTTEETVTAANGSTSVVTVGADGTVSTSGAASVVSETKTENEDGTTTVKKTVRNAVGAETTVETVSDGKGNVQSVTQTSADATGALITTTSDSAGTVTTTTKQPNGTVVTEKTTADGRTTVTTETGSIVTEQASSANGTSATRVTDKATGDVTTTIAHTNGTVETTTTFAGDGTTVKEMTSADGSKTMTTVTDASGKAVSSSVKTMQPDGGSQVVTTMADNTTKTVTTSAGGAITETVTAADGKTVLSESTIQSNGQVQTRGGAKMSDAEVVGTDEHGRTICRKTLTNALGEETTIETVMDSHNNVTGMKATSAGVSGKGMSSVEVNSETGTVTVSSGNKTAGITSVVTDSATGSVSSVTRANADGSVSVKTASGTVQETVNAAGSRTMTRTDADGTVSVESNHVTGSSDSRVTTANGTQLRHDHVNAVGSSSHSYVNSNGNSVTVSSNAVSGVSTATYDAQTGNTTTVTNDALGGSSQVTTNAAGRVTAARAVSANGQMTATSVNGQMTRTATMYANGTVEDTKVDAGKGITDTSVRRADGGSERVVTNAVKGTQYSQVTASGGQTVTTATTRAGTTVTSTNAVGAVKTEAYDNKTGVKTIDTVSADGTRIMNAHNAVTGESVTVMTGTAANGGSEVIRQKGDVVSKTATSAAGNVAVDTHNTKTGASHYSSQAVNGDFVSVTNDGKGNESVVTRNANGSSSVVTKHSDGSIATSTTNSRGVNTVGGMTADGQTIAPEVTNAGSYAANTTFAEKFRSRYNPVANAVNNFNGAVDRVQGGAFGAIDASTALAGKAIASVGNMMASNAIYSDRADAARFYQNEGQRWNSNQSYAAAVSGMINASMGGSHSSRVPQAAPQMMAQTQPDGSTIMVPNYSAAGMQRTTPMRAGQIASTIAGGMANGAVYSDRADAARFYQNEGQRQASVQAYTAAVSSGFAPQGRNSRRRVTNTETVEEETVYNRSNNSRMSGGGSFNANAFAGRDRQATARTNSTVNVEENTAYAYGGSNGSPAYQQSSGSGSVKGRNTRTKIDNTAAFEENTAYAYGGSNGSPAYQQSSGSGSAKGRNTRTKIDNTAAFEENTAYAYGGSNGSPAYQQSSGGGSAKGRTATQTVTNSVHVAEQTVYSQSGNGSVPYGNPNVHQAASQFTAAGSAGGMSFGGNQGFYGEQSVQQSGAFGGAHYNPKHSGSYAANSNPFAGFEDTETPQGKTATVHNRTDVVNETRYKNKKTGQEQPMDMFGSILGDNQPSSTDSTASDFAKGVAHDVATSASDKLKSIRRKFNRK